LTLAAATLGWSLVLAPEATHAPPSAQAPARPVTAGFEQSSRRTDAPPAEPANARGGDVVFEDYPLRDADLAPLHRGDRIELPHPDGGTIDLRVERVESTRDRRHLTLLHDGLSSTFTEARGAFFGTLATPRGVYALEGNAQHSRLTRHALLDQRMNSNVLDYRPLPSS
jgi:hypothetical protein